MKRFISLAACLLLAFAGCSRHELSDDSLTTVNPLVFRALAGDQETRTAIDSRELLWSDNDAISIFHGSGANRRFLISEGAGTGEATFTEVLGPVTSDISLSCNYAVYPYHDGTSVDADGTLHVLLPETQVYTAGTFGPGYFPMVCATGDLSDDILRFRNLCGAMVVHLTGTDRIVRLTLKGNRAEKLSGPASVQASPDAAPVLAMDPDASASVTLSYTSGVQLGSEPTAFWMVIPPTYFEAGVTLEIEDSYGATMTKKISKPLSVGRNDIQPFDAFRYTPAQSQFCTFPDAGFQSYCIANFDRDGDRKISRSEAALVTSIELSTNSIASLEGIQNFTGLLHLVCRGTLGEAGRLTKLDLSKNTLLETLDCSSNTAIKTLDLTRNTELRRVVCTCDSLSTLNINNSTKLEYLDCSTNRISSLTLNKCTNLKYLDCSRNSISTLNISALQLLDELYVHNNSLTSLGVSRVPSLRVIHCGGNSITSLTLTGMSSLEELNCHGNNIRKLELADCSRLEYLDISGNSFTASPDLSGCPALKYLQCQKASLTSLNVLQNPALVTLDCSHNAIASLDVSNLANLTDLSCHFNGLASLQLSGTGALVALQCASNALTQLDLSSCTSLKRIHCHENNLTSLDLSALSPAAVYCQRNPSLATLYLRGGWNVPVLIYDEEVTTVVYL